MRIIYDKLLEIAYGCR